MKRFVRITALFLAALFLSGAGLAAFDVLTHDDVLRNPELRLAGGWLMSGLMLLALGMRGWRQRSQSDANTVTGKPSV